MLKELINVIGDILTCPRPEPDVLGPKDIEKILKKRRKIKVVTNKE